jgi:hypothetical protein
VVQISAHTVNFVVQFANSGKGFGQRALYQYLFSSMFWHVITATSSTTTYEDLRKGWWGGLFLKQRLHTDRISRQQKSRGD